LLLSDEDEEPDEEEGVDSEDEVVEGVVAGFSDSIPFFRDSDG
jgi:hypothetical protein